VPVTVGRPVYPVFLRLEGEPVVIVGGGTVATAKLANLVAARARITVVAPSITPRLRAHATTVVERAFVPRDLDGARFVVAAATPDVNRAVAAAAAERNIFCNAVDDADVATAFLGAVVRRGTVTVAISTGGAAPALAALLRESIDALLPDELDDWIDQAMKRREAWRAEGIDLAARREMLRAALRGTGTDAESGTGTDVVGSP
jgi:uroporphyrin-III C-methyltransferase/precorrin-2 dehydrogenase/sirohydrochlorin ferrochelatase